MLAIFNLLLFTGSALLNTKSQHLNERLDSICNTYFVDRCDINEPYMNEIYATLNTTNGSDVMIRVVMPKKFDDFVLQVLTEDGQAPGQFLDKDGNLTGPCIEYTDYNRISNLSSSAIAINETDISIQVTYHVNNTRKPGHLLFGTRSTTGCFQWVKLINLTSSAMDMEFVEIVITPDKDLLTIVKTNESIASEESTTTEDIGKPPLGFLDDGTWVFYFDEPSDELE